MSNDILLSRTSVRMVQSTFEGSVELIRSDFILVDLLVSNLSDGMATVIATDGERQVIIASVQPQTTFSHAFRGGWLFWKGAKLVIVKESNDGVINSSAGFLKATGPNYNVWRNK
jgi:hypothetical protein